MNNLSSWERELWHLWALDYSTNRPYWIWNLICVYCMDVRRENKSNQTYWKL